MACEEGLLPLLKSDTRHEDLEEEARLAFVGMTRAKDWLHMSRARRVLLGYGRDGEWCDSEWSRWADEGGARQARRHPPALVLLVLLQAVACPRAAAGGSVPAPAAAAANPCTAATNATPRSRRAGTCRW